MGRPRLLVIPAAAIVGTVATFLALGIAGLSGIFVPLVLVAGPALLPLNEGPGVLVMLAMAGVLYGAYAYILSVWRWRAVVWLFAFHFGGGSLAFLVWPLRP